jgi:hypothetical protein
MDMESRTNELVLGACVLAVFLVGSMLSAAKGLGGTATDKATADALAAIVPLTLEERMESYKKLLEERTQTIGALLLVVKEMKDSPAANSNTRGLLAFTVRMLGVLRAAEAAQPLLDIIDSLRYYPGYGGTEAPKDSEVIQALVQIGKPASTKAVEYLANDKSSKRAPMYVRVIAQVEGIELGKVMVRMAADREKDPEKKARLQAAIGLFDKAGEPIP